VVGAYPHRAVEPLALLHQRREGLRGEGHSTLTTRSVRGGGAHAHQAFSRERLRELHSGVEICTGRAHILNKPPAEKKLVQQKHSGAKIRAWGGPHSHQAAQGSLK
jgi:hypothetical protein